LTACAGRDPAGVGRPLFLGSWQGDGQPPRRLLVPPGWTVWIFFRLSGFLIGGILLNVAILIVIFRLFIFGDFPNYPSLLCVDLDLHPAIAFDRHFLTSRIWDDRTRRRLHSRAILFFAKSASFFRTRHFILVVYSTWSLAVEEQFYLVAPVVVKYCPASLTVFLVAVTITAPSAAMVRSGSFQFRA